MKILTKRDLQSRIGQIGGEAFTVVNRGKPEILILPYFEGSEEWVEDYMEEFEMSKNRQKLQKEMMKSKASGLANFSI